MKEFIALNINDEVYDEETKFERCNIRRCTFNALCHFDRCNIIECVNTENCDCVKSNIIEHEVRGPVFYGESNPVIEVESTEIIYD